MLTANQGRPAPHNFASAASAGVGEACGEARFQPPIQGFQPLAAPFPADPPLGSPRAAFPIAPNATSIASLRRKLSGAMGSAGGGGAPGARAGPARSLPCSARLRPCGQRSSSTRRPRRGGARCSARAWLWLGAGRAAPPFERSREGRRRRCRGGRFEHGAFSVKGFDCLQCHRRPDMPKKNVAILF